MLSPVVYSLFLLTLQLFLATPFAIPSYVPPFSPPLYPFHTPPEMFLAASRHRTFWCLFPTLFRVICSRCSWPPTAHPPFADDASSGDPVVPACFERLLTFHTRPVTQELKPTFKGSLLRRRSCDISMLWVRFCAHVQLARDPRASFPPSLPFLPFCDGVGPSVS